MADAPSAADAREELLRHLEDPDAVIILNGDGSLHGVRRLTIGEMLAEVGGDDDD